MIRFLGALPLSARIALASAATIAAALASYGFVAQRQQQRAMLAAATRAAASAASDAADGSVHHLLIGDYAALDQLLLRLARNPEVARITVARPDGTALAEVVRVAPGEPPRITLSPPRVHPPPYTEIQIDAGGEEVVVWNPVLARAPLGWVRLVHRLDAVRAAARDMTESAVVLTLVWTVAATLALLALLRAPVVWIRRLADVARGLAAGKRDGVAPPRSAPPEIAQLAAALNEAARDLQDRERLQAAFEQAKKLEVVGRLAGGVAHDFNNVLTVILGNLELALLEIPPGQPLAESLEEMREAAQNAASLTRQLLAFSRKSPVEPRVLDLDGRLARMTKMLSRLIGEDVVLRVEPGGGGRVRVDAGQLEQILMNLAVNARDAMPKGGDLVIRTGRERIEQGDPRLPPGAAPGEYAVLSVADSGTGMDDEVKQHLFEPFFTTKESGKGTGLGLATVYGAAAQSRGFLTVESAVGRGTTFRLHLPSVPEMEADLSSTPASEALRGGDETILLVEDEAPVRRLASRVLERGGYRVIACASGDEAIAAARRERGPVHLVVSDVVMPGMDGPTLAGRLASIRPGVRVLFVSGYPGRSSAALDALAREGAVVLAKPFSAAALSRAVREALDAGSRAQPRAERV